MGSLLAPSSWHAQAVARALQGGSVLGSAALAAEMRAVLARPVFDRYGPMRDRLAAAEALLARLQQIDPVPAVRACPDPKDDFLLGLAVAGQGGLILSDDRDLWRMRVFAGIPIWTSRHYLFGARRSGSQAVTSP